MFDGTSVISLFQIYITQFIDFLKFIKIVFHHMLLGKDSYNYSDIYETSHEYEELNLKKKTLYSCQFLDFRPSFYFFIFLNNNFEGRELGFIILHYSNPIKHRQIFEF